MLYKYLCEHYKKDEPIFLSDISIPGMSEESIRYHLKKLADNGKICRFDAGIYYFPSTDLFGEPSVLAVEIVAIHKYIARQGKRMGFYSGYTLANRMHLSTQVPYVEEITSNNAPAAVREVVIQGHKYVLRKPLVEVTNENAPVLEFLECLKDIDKCAEEDMKTCGEFLSEYVKLYDITKEMVDKYIGFYPLKVYKALYETEVKFPNEKLQISARG